MLMHLLKAMLTIYPQLSFYYENLDLIKLVSTLKEQCDSFHLEEV